MLDRLPVRDVPADPVFGNERINLETRCNIRTADDKYGYDRAYRVHPRQVLRGKTVLDLTAGGGSIPFEALRCGATTIANELNPVASTILAATLDYPFRYGRALADDIARWGKTLRDNVVPSLIQYYPASPVAGDPGQTEQLDGYLFCRVVTCPHCGKRTPLLTSGWLAHRAKDAWGVEIVPSGDGCRFTPYRVTKGRGPQGQDPETATVEKGVGRCVHCGQAIDSEEIKRQTRGESAVGRLEDELYVVAAVRTEPVLKDGLVQRCASGENRGQVKTKQTLFFRAASEADRAALAAAKRALAERWDRWDRLGLIPTEKIPAGHKEQEPLRFGMARWCDMFTPRQLLANLTCLEELNRLKPQVLAELGPERGKAVVTYLQFVFDKILDYNSRLTLWDATRTKIAHTFTRHDLSIKWTFPELIIAGEQSGLAWALDQVIDAYNGLADLAEPVFTATGGRPPLTLLHGSAEHLALADASVDAIVFDPPYYNNVEYAELSDYFYVWDKRTLAGLYPGLYGSRLTDKDDEAVANPVRAGGEAEAKAFYEAMMARIFAEGRRVLKDDGLLLMMFTHKSGDAWETMTRALIEAGFEITATWPVDSEDPKGIHSNGKANAQSSIFIACRKRPSSAPGVWRGFGGGGVQAGIRTAVAEGLKELAPLRLNATDEMVSAYGRALQVLSQHWPVNDGERPVGPREAMDEASAVVAAHELERISAGTIKVTDLEPEAAFAVILLGLYGTGEFAYDGALTLSRSLGIAMQQVSGGYTVGSDLAVASAKDLADKGIVWAPVVKRGSKLRLAQAEERTPERLLDAPRTAWDRLQGLLLSYTAGDVPMARAYLDRHCPDRRVVLALLKMWQAHAHDEERRHQASLLRYGLGEH